MQNPTRIEQVAATIRTRHPRARGGDAALGQPNTPGFSAPSRAWRRRGHFDHVFLACPRALARVEATLAGSPNAAATAGPRNRAGSTRPAPA